jgi:hypothetical protein
MRPRRGRQGRPQGSSQACCARVGTSLHPPLAQRRCEVSPQIRSSRIGLSSGPSRPWARTTLAYVQSLAIRVVGQRDSA